MFDIITFGSATRDIMVRPKNVTSLKYEKKGPSGQSICFPLGSKIDIEEMQLNTGGGGTNTAATFSKQGFKTAFYGMVGKDVSGQELINELKSLKIYSKFVAMTDKKPTNHSIVILGNAQDRTILSYRGAAELLSGKEIFWNKLKTKWIYLAPLSGLLCDTFEDIVNFAFDNKIKVAVNPSNQQLSLPLDSLTRILKKVDILILNKEEASFLTKVPFSDESGIFKKIDEICPGIAVMTKGGEGVVVSDGQYFYSALPDPSRKIIDTTGAGDSFAAGFLSDYIRNNGDIEKAIQLGLANSAGNLNQVGSKTGLLSKNDEFERVQVVKQLCTENNLCLPK